jgi:hypothetical protein
MDLHPYDTECHDTTRHDILKIWYPPTFFDLMAHLLIHLLDESEICGLMGVRWCYLVERYLNVLKRYVRNRAWP